LTLADINEDGTVDQTDADLIHDAEVYQLGDVDGSGRGHLFDAYYVSLYIAVNAAGLELEDAYPFAIDITIDEVTLNLMDADADGDIDIQDAHQIQAGFCMCAAYNGLESAYYSLKNEGQYFLNWSANVCGVVIETD